MSTNTTTDTATIQKVVFDALETFGAEPTEITLDATFEALDIDSLDIAELAQIVDEKFGVEIKSSDAEQIKTVGEVIELVAARS
jgi:acyl carrier protein